MRGVASPLLIGITTIWPSETGQLQILVTDWHLVMFPALTSHLQIMSFLIIDHSAERPTVHKPHPL
jgi:hypothetical protein